MVFISAFAFMAALVPPLGILAGYKLIYARQTNWRACAFCFAVFIAAIAYSYIPTNEPDLMEYFSYIDQIKDMTFTDALGIGLHNQNGLAAFTALSWIIGQLGDYHILPAITVFVVYYVGIYITGMIGEDLHAPRNGIAAYITFILLCPSLHSITNNIRNIFSFSLIGLAVFRDCYQKKRNLTTLILYILPIYFHSSAFVLILLRLTLFLSGKWKVISLGIIMMVKPLVDFVYATFYGRISGTSLIMVTFRDMIRRAYRYFNDTSSVWGLVVQRSGSQRAMRYCYIALAVIFCIMAIIISRKKKWDSIERAVGIDGYGSRLKSIIDYSFVLGLMTISCAPMLMPEYWRFASIMILISGPVYLIAKTYSSGKLEAMLRRSIFLLMLPCMLLWMREFRNSELLILLLKPFISSPFLVTIMAFANLII